MSASLIRSRAMVTHAIDRHRWNEITDGAVLQEDGAIVEIGTYRDLSRRHPNVAVIGSGNEVMLPGFVNGHHHIGLTPVQLGSPDMPLELWFVRLVPAYTAPPAAEGPKVRRLTAGGSEIRTLGPSLM